MYRRALLPAFAVSVATAAAILTCADSASSTRLDNLLDAGPAPIAPPPVEDDAAADAEPIEPFCDACAAR